MVRIEEWGISLRGGGEDEKNGTTNTETSNAASPRDGTESSNSTVVKVKPSATARPQKKGWFRLLFQQTKAIASRNTTATASLLAIAASNNETTRSPNQHNTAASHNRGGALVKARPKRKNKWWQSTTHFFVSTWESQYETDNASKQKQTDQQLALVTNATNNTTTSKNATQATVSTKEALDNTPLWERLRRTVWGSQTTVTPQNNNTAHTNKTSATTANIGRASPQFRRQTLRPTSRYESSGGWNAFDYILSLGMSSRDPRWRLSRVLRPWRKQMANVTGLHGIISGKSKRNRATVAVDKELFMSNRTTTMVNERNETAQSPTTTASSSAATTVGSNDTVADAKSLLVTDQEEETGLLSKNQSRQDRRGHHHKKKKHRHAKKKHRDDDAEQTVAEEKQTESLSDSNVTSSQSLTNATMAAKRLDYVSSGLWQPIDRFFSLGLAQNHPSVRLSKKLRPVRKVVARTTGWHGALSGKPHFLDKQAQQRRRQLQFRRMRSRLNATTAASRVAASNETQQVRRSFWGVRRKMQSVSSSNPVLTKAEQERVEEERRRQQVEAIDKRIEEAQKLLGRLACEKDVLQRRHSPFWNYTATSKTMSREFVFPPDDLVDEYLEMLFASGRLVKLNHTDLWRNNFEDDDEEDELSEPSDSKRPQNGEAGSWFLRNGLGEKIGASTETAAYKAVGKGIMGGLARALAALHGINVMGYSDIRLNTEQTPALPPSAGLIAGGSRNYAQDAIHDAIRRGSRKRPRSSDFLQKAAVVETLTSQAQIAMPLLRMFPMSWQRALLGNILVLVTAVMSDFCEGIELQLLGHKLTLSFTPITEEDMMRNMVRDSLQKRPTVNTEQFEAAVQATANDIAKSLNFLDRWHHKALGAGNLKLQIATLISRLVLTLVNDVLNASQMSLWTEQAGGPTLLPGFEFRTSPNYLREEETVIDVC